MIDLHTHILSYVDDGAETFDITLRMLEEEVRQGVDTICLTPHLRRDMFEASDDKIKDQFQFLLAKAVEYEIPAKLYLSREYHADSLFRHKLEKGSLLTLGSGKFILLEFSNRHSYVEIKEYISQVLDAGFTPLIAHVERYDVIRKNIQYAEELISCGAKLQCNVDAILGKNGFKLKHFTGEMMKRNLIYAAASDCHDLTARKPNLMAGRKYLVKKMGEDYAERILLKNPGEIMGL